MKRITLASAALAGTLAVPAAAQAHVTLQPKSAPAGAYVVENVRVPNESDDAATTKVVVQFPEGFAGASYQRVAGWDVKVVKAKLPAPITTDDGEITEGVKTITWTATSKADGIAPGEFQDFPISVQIPNQAGDSLTFKALQTYSDGEVARWIGAPDADKPAPQIQVTAAQDDHAAGGGGTTTTEEAAAPAAPARASGGDDDGDDGGGSDGLAIAALIVGGLGLLAGGAGLVTSRRHATT